MPSPGCRAALLHELGGLRTPGSRLSGAPMDLRERCNGVVRQRHISRQPSARRERAQPGGQMQIILGVTPTR